MRILSAVLNAQETANFPDFSNDGAYLKFLHIEDVIKCIGDRDDDYKNAFTARMLLLLESKFLYNEPSFKVFRDRIISVYFTDFHNHSEEFKPIFLLNDVLRFWRTLCLNYEHSRHWRDEQDQYRQAKGHLDNLKLKFSRMNICYSFISHLLAQGKSIARENVIETAEKTPFERLQDIAERDAIYTPLIAQMHDEYSWFLSTTDKPKNEMLDWMLFQENRDLAFEHASRFVGLTGELVRKIADQHGYLRYLIV